MADDLASGFQSVDHASDFDMFSSCLTLIDSRTGAYSAVHAQAKPDATFANCATPPDATKAITHGLNLRAGAKGYIMKHEASAKILTAIRRVLSPPEGGPLRSNDFTIRISRRGGRIERVDIDGRGNGHGVGMCQWGAIGRARAGQDYRTILGSYFPGTEIQRLY